MFFFFKSFVSFYLSFTFLSTYLILVMKSTIEPTLLGLKRLFVFTNINNCFVSECNQCSIFFYSRLVTFIYISFSFPLSSVFLCHTLQVFRVTYFFCDWGVNVNHLLFRLMYIYVCINIHISIYTHLSTNIQDTLDGKLNVYKSTYFLIYV